MQKDDRRTVADRRVIKADAVDLVESYTAARGPHATDHLAEVLGAAQLPWAYGTDKRGSVNRRRIK